MAAALRPGGRFAWNAFVFDPFAAARDHGAARPRDAGRIWEYVEHTPADNRVDVTSYVGGLGAPGRTVTLWWATRSEWEGLIESGGPRGRGALRLVRRPPVRRALERVRLGRPQALTSPYDPIATLYDPWSRSVVEDVPFYVEAAKEAGGPVVELGIGTGRIAVPTAAAGIRVIGVDSSPGMLEVCREAARLAGVEELLDLRLGDLREPPVEERVSLVTSPFRALLHMEDDEQRLQALRAARGLLRPGGRLIFDVFRPSREDIEQTHARWLEREPGIWERADWDVEGRRSCSRCAARTAARRCRSPGPSPRSGALLEQAGFEVEGFYGWFDRRRYRGGEDSVWVARRG